MSHEHDTLLRQAVDQGILPPAALQDRRPAANDRHWAVVLLTALGAWLALLPLLILFAFALSDWIERGAGTYVIGAMMLAAAVAVLRAEELPVFLEQLALPAMLTGAGLLGFGLARDLSEQAAGAIGLAIALACTAAIPRPWLRVLLGAACALLFCTMLWPDDDPSTLYAGLPTWVIVHAALLLWMLLLAAQWRALGQSAAQTRMAAALEPFATGWLLAVLAGLAWSFYSILTRKILALGYKSLQVTRRCFFYGLLFMLPALFIFDCRLGLERFASPVNTLNLLYLGFGASALCFVTWNWAVRILGAVKTTVYIYLVPVVTVVSSVIILHETITPLAIVGTALTLTGLIVSQR